MRRPRACECRILVPETASYPKIAQIAACGADVLTIRGSRQDVADAAVRMSAEIFYASHNWVPFFTEGTKTLAYELWEQLGFAAPDNVVTPLGYGSNVLGCLRGFDELVRNGEIERVPRIFGVQAENCAPYYAAWKAGATALVPTDDQADDRRRHRVVEADAREGSARTACARAAARSWRSARPRSSTRCASSRARASTSSRLRRRGAAGLTQLLASGAIKPDETTVLVLTGTGLKASERIGELLSSRALGIENRMSKHRFAPAQDPVGRRR